MDDVSYAFDNFIAMGITMVKKLGVEQSSVSARGELNSGLLLPRQRDELPVAGERLIDDGNRRRAYAALRNRQLPVSSDEFFSSGNQRRESRFSRLMKNGAQFFRTLLGRDERALVPSISSASARQHIEPAERQGPTQPSPSQSISRYYVGTRAGRSASDNSVNDEFVTNINEVSATRVPRLQDRVDAGVLPPSYEESEKAARLGKPAQSRSVSTNPGIPSPVPPEPREGLSASRAALIARAERSGYSR
jgi:hypothetical protein